MTPLVLDREALSVTPVSYGFDRIVVTFTNRVWSPTPGFADGDPGGAFRSGEGLVRPDAACSGPCGGSAAV